MILIRQDIERTGTGFTTREWAPVIKGAWELAGKVFHRAVTPKHFTFSGGREYGYQDRTKLYQLRKAKTKGHQRQLVWSGQAERDAMRIRDIRPSGKGVRIVYHMPKYFWIRPKRAGEIDKGKELQTVSAKDELMIVQVIDREIERAMGRAGRPLSPELGHQTGLGPE